MITEIDIQEVKDKHCGHWFSPETMRHFQSRTSQTAYVGPGGTFFVSSERQRGETCIRSWSLISWCDRKKWVPSHQRYYTVREQAADGSIKTVGEFQGFSDRRAAHSVAKAYARGES